MSWLMPALLAASLGSLLAGLVYGYLFYRERHRALLVWSASWGLYAFRFLIQFAMLDGILPAWTFIPQQTVSIASAVLFLWGAHLFTDRQLPFAWPVAGVAATLWATVAHRNGFSFLAANLPVDLLMGLIYGWSGVVVNRYLADRLIPGRAAGWCMIFWGLHKANYAFLRPVVWFAPFGFLLAFLLFLATAISVILVYYERNRQDLQREIALVQASDDRFRGVVESTSDAIFIADAAGQILFANQGAATLFGYPPGELEGKELVNLMPERYRVDHKAGMARVAAGGPSGYLGRNLEFFALHRDGREFPISLTVASWKTADEVFFSGIVRDITEQRRATEELRNSHRLFAAVFEGTTDAIFLKDLKGRYLMANSATMRAIGRSREEILGRTDRELFPEGSAAVIEDVDRPVLEEGRVMTVEEHLEISDGPSVWLTNKSPYRDDEGRITGLIGISRNVTELRRADRALQEQERLLTNVFDSIQDGISVLDRDLNIVRVNAAAQKIFAKAGPLPGKKCYQAYHQRKEPCTVCPSRRAMASGKVEREEIVVTAADGQERYMEVTAFPLFDADGAVNGVVENGRDITARKRVEAEREELAAQLRQALKMEAIGTLAGGIAHDFNNILGIILGYTDLCLDELAADHPGREFLDEVTRAGLRAKELVRQILAFSRRREQQREPLKVAAVVREGVKFLRASIPTSVEIREEIDDECGTILADPTQMHQVLLNLCTNAAQAMEDGGTLSVTLKQVLVNGANRQEKGDPPAGRYVVLIVSDTGSGIDPAIRERIFDPYFTTKEVGKGSGMGLAVVYGIVRNHGGTLTVESEVGVGTRFTVFFPLLAAREEERINAGDDAAMPTGTGRILFVDDEKGLREIVEKTLSRLGYTVTVQESGPGALELFRQDPRRFDLMITDQTMPLMSGIALTQRVLALRPDLPIILCTGYSGRISEQEALAAGVAAFAMKPLVGRELAGLVHQLLVGKLNEPPPS